MLVIRVNGSNEKLFTILLKTRIAALFFCPYRRMTTLFLGLPNVGKLSPVHDIVRTNELTDGVLNICAASNARSDLVLMVFITHLRTRNGQEKFYTRLPKSRRLPS
jgi:hypothetical protein